MSEQRQIIEDGSSKTRAAYLLAMIAGIASGAGMVFPAPRAARKTRKPFPMMVTASREEIAAWNAEVAKKSPKERAERLLRRRLVRMSGGIRQYKRQERNANKFAAEFGEAA